MNSILAISSKRFLKKKAKNIQKKESKRRCQNGKMQLHVAMSYVHHQLYIIQISFSIFIFAYRKRPFSVLLSCLLLRSGWTHGPITGLSIKYSSSSK